MVVFSVLYVCCVAVDECGSVTGSGFCPPSHIMPEEVKKVTSLTPANAVEAATGWYVVRRVLL